jgi:hypothetical protein
VTSALLRTAIALVRCWTAVYTWRMPADLRSARRAEIESDLWESQHADPSSVWLPADIVTRLMLGLWDDLRWRAEQERHPVRSFRTALTAAGVAVAMLALFWLAPPVVSVKPLQSPPRPALAREWKPLPPPPPPPPPLCNPPGIGLPVIAPCTPSITAAGTRDVASRDSADIGARLRQASVSSIVCVSVRPREYLEARDVEGWTIRRSRLASDLRSRFVL